jgi:hypothetical protein
MIKTTSSTGRYIHCVHILLEFCTYKWEVHNGKIYIISFNHKSSFSISPHFQFLGVYQGDLAVSVVSFSFNLNWIDTINIVTIRMEEQVGKSRGLDVPIAMPTVCWQICPLNIKNVLSMKKRNRVFWWCLFVRIRVGFFLSCKIRFVSS